MPSMLITHIIMKNTKKQNSSQDNMSNIKMSHENFLIIETPDYFLQTLSGNNKTYI